MPPLSAAQVLRLWEIGASQSPARRALMILEAASPGTSAGDLAALPVGVRDRRLLDVQRETFGERLDAVLACPACGERVEFQLDTATLFGDDVAGAASNGDMELASGDWHVRYRMPTAGDLVDVAACDDATRAVSLLVERCIVNATRSGEPAPASDIPSSALALMDDELARRDVLAEIVLDFACPTCGRPGQAPFDVARYLWEELRAEAVRLLREVHSLARAYGWRESEILALSAARRHSYLELALS